MKVFESLQMLIKEEDIIKGIYDDRTFSLEEYFKNMQNYMISLDKVLTPKDIKEQDKENYAYDKRNSNYQNMNSEDSNLKYLSKTSRTKNYSKVLFNEFLRKNSDQIKYKQSNYKETLKQQKYYHQQSSHYIEDTLIEINGLDNMMIETFPDYKKVVDDSEQIEDFNYNEY